MIPSFCVFAVGGCYYWISLFYIWEAAVVTDFYGVPVEDFAQFVVLGEVLVDQGEEDFGNIGGYIDEGIALFSCGRGRCCLRGFLRFWE